MKVCVHCAFFFSPAQLPFVSQTLQHVLGHSIYLLKQHHQFSKAPTHQHCRQIHQVNLLCESHSFIKFCSDIFTGSAASCQITAVLTQQCPLWCDTLVVFIDYYFLKIMLAHKLDYIAHLPKSKGGNMEERGSTFKDIVLKWTKKHFLS